ncbi:MAG: cytoplasmic protein [Deltaproteobacteria bacterium]|nr:cytoplasmic protein [Deltaproteobacteria bacterium]
MTERTYGDFDATELYCPQCKRAVPVRKRLLLVITGGDKYDYTCVYCGTSVGDKTESNRDDSRIILR